MSEIEELAEELRDHLGLGEELAERDMSLSSRIKGLAHHVEHTLAQTQACMWDAIHDLETELSELKSTVQVIQNYVCGGY